MKRKEHKSAAFDTVDMTSATVLCNFQPKGMKLKCFVQIQRNAKNQKQMYSLGTSL